MKKRTIQAEERERIAPAADGSKPRHRPGAASVQLLTYVTVIFQISGFMLVAFKSQPVDMQPLAFAVIFPIITVAASIAADRRWHVDRPLMVMVLLLCSIGMVTLSDITKPVTSRKHALFLIPALAAMLMTIVIMRRMKRWEMWAKIAIPVSIAFMLMPMLPKIGGTINGARNWVSLKALHIDMGLQPSEFVKIPLLLVVASSLAGSRGFKSVALALGFAVAQCLILLLIQRDLGTLLIYFFVTLAMYYAATSNLMLTLMGLLGGAAGSVGAYYMFDHVRTRVAIWKNPWSDSQDKGYQIVQALIAISSGGMIGRGLGLGTPRIIPYYHTDFIYAAICEEFGLIFAVGLIIIYAFVVLRGIRIALEATTAFHGLMAFGATIMLAVQTFIIIGGVVKMIPLTGVTLPFISAGGSSIISSMILVGILLGVSSINNQERSNIY